MCECVLSKRTELGRNREDGLQPNRPARDSAAGPVSSRLQRQRLNRRRRGNGAKLRCRGVYKSFNLLSFQVGKGVAPFPTAW
ncbi:MAG: hypothetical protein ACI9W4_002941 [Rhodothermales bacterium]|jgi:hypothetical protein